VAVGDGVTVGGSDSILVGKNVSTGIGSSMNQIFGVDTHILTPHTNVLALGAGPIEIDRSNVEYIGTGIVYDKTNNTMELLKGALQLGGESTNLGGGILVVEQNVGMATQNSYNTSASFEAGLSLVQTENGARIEKWKIQVEPGDFLKYDLVFESDSGTRVVYTDDYEPGITNFTGQHRCLLHIEDMDSVKIGQVVCSTGKYAGLANEQVTIDESIPIVRICTTKEDPTAFGVISHLETVGDMRSIAVGNLRFLLHKPFMERRVRVNGAGEGGILVCNEGGNIKNGDLLCTSSKSGYAMKQNSVYVSNSTCAKSTCDLDFSLSDNDMVGCLYKF
jgi:hypothetical protein